MPIFKTFGVLYAHSATNFAHRLRGVKRIIQSPPPPIFPILSYLKEFSSWLDSMTSN